MSEVINFENVFFSNSQGEGLISNTKDISIERNSQETHLGNNTFNVGCSITLDGFFSFPHEFVGRIKGNELVFYCGFEFDLFEERHFFKVINYITPKRIFVMYTPQSGRDYNFVNGIWK
jgi:hypothetical protein